MDRKEYTYCTWFMRDFSSKLPTARETTSVDVKCFSTNLWPAVVTCSKISYFPHKCKSNEKIRLIKMFLASIQPCHLWRTINADDISHFSWDQQILSISRILYLGKRKKGENVDLSGRVAFFECSIRTNWPIGGIATVLMWPALKIPEQKLCHISTNKCILRTFTIVQHAIACLPHGWVFISDFSLLESKHGFYSDKTGSLSAYQK